MNMISVTSTVLSIMTLMVAALVFTAAPARVSAQGGPLHELTIAASDGSGKEISGMWMSIRFTNGTYIGSGYTPLTFPSEQGGTYVVTASHYNSITFKKWEDGSTNSSRT